MAGITDRYVKLERGQTWVHIDEIVVTKQEVIVDVKPDKVDVVSVYVFRDGKMTAFLHSTDTDEDRAKRERRGQGFVSAEAFESPLAFEKHMNEYCYLLTDMLAFERREREAARRERFGDSPLLTVEVSGREWDDEIERLRTAEPAELMAVFAQLSGGHESMSDEDARAALTRLRVFHASLKDELLAATSPPPPDE